MLALFKNIFRGFKKDLINGFHKEHQTLIKIYGEINKSIEKENYKKTKKLLDKFYKNYHKHILKEDNYFYTYLRKKFRQEKNTDLLNFIDQKQKEMENITVFIKHFLKKYQSPKTIKNNIKEFKKEFESLGTELTKRVEFEEKKLYPLYKK